MKLTSPLKLTLKEQVFTPIFYYLLLILPITVSLVISAVEGIKCKGSHCGVKSKLLELRSQSPDDITNTSKSLLTAERKSIWIQVRCNNSDDSFNKSSNQGNEVRLCAKTVQGGELLIRDWSWTWKTVPKNRYCLLYQNLEIEQEEDNDLLFCDDDQLTMALNTLNSNQSDGNAVVGLICSEYFDKQKELWINVTVSKARVVFGILISVSGLLYVFILVLLVMQWKTQGFAGGIMVCFVTSKFLLHVINGPWRIWGNTINSQTDPPTLGCALLGIGMHFLQLTSFCWLAVLSFDIWWTFRKLSLRRKESKNLLRFILYTVFGFGIPATIVTLGLMLEQFHGDHDCGIIITPRYGSRSCYLQPASLAPYLVYPAGILIFTNLCFFWRTTFNLKHHRRASSMSRENIAKNAEQLSLYFKLFFTMDIPWVCAMIAFIFQIGIIALWAIGAILSILHPVMIFIIFMRTSEMKKTIRAAFQIWKPNDQSRPNIV